LQREDIIEATKSKHYPETIDWPRPTTTTTKKTKVELKGT